MSPTKNASKEEIKIILQCTLSLLGENGENWIKFPPIIKEGKHCLATALITACDNSYPLFNQVSYELIPENYYSLARFNDNPDTTFQDVKNKILDAIKRNEI